MNNFKMSDPSTLILVVDDDRDLVRVAFQYP